MDKGKLIVISAPSGCGKSTIIKQIIDDERLKLGFSISATSRKPRQGEEHGVHYYFVTKEEFESMIAAGDMLEYSAHAANYYGTPLDQLEEKLASGDVILDVEPAGAKIVKEKRPDAVLIFIGPPSAEELERRLRGRGDTSEEQIALRLDRAKWEMEQRSWYDHIVVNDVLEDCVKEMTEIIGTV